MDAITEVPVPVNEPVHDYAPDSAERTRLRAALAALADQPRDLPHIIAGRHRMAMVRASTSSRRTGAPPCWAR